MQSMRRFFVPGWISKLVTRSQILRVGADRRVRPRVSKFNSLRLAMFDSRLRGGCIACVPRSPDVTRNPADLSVRLGLPVTSGGQVGRPSPMVDAYDSICCGGNAIVDGARPDSRRMDTGIQSLIAEQSG